MFVENTNSSDAENIAVSYSNNITREVTDITFQNYPEHILIKGTGSLVAESLNNRISTRTTYGLYKLQGCFTVFRHCQTEETNVFENQRKLTTEKTDQELKTDRNERTKKILFKYKDQDFLKVNNALAKTF